MTTSRPPVGGIPGRRDKGVCHHCGRVVSRDRAKQIGKGFARHKCPHGRWCSAGDVITCTSNYSMSCPECRDGAHERANTPGFDAYGRRLELVEGIERGRVS